jgi:hypothetical protein
MIAQNEFGELIFYCWKGVNTLEHRVMLEHTLACDGEYITHTHTHTHTLLYPNFLNTLHDHLRTTESNIYGFPNVLSPSIGKTTPTILATYYGLRPTLQHSLPLFNSS